MCQGSIVRKKGSAIASLGLALLLDVALGHVSTARADDDRESIVSPDDAREHIRERVQQGEIKSLAELRRIVADKVDGEIVSTSIDQEHGITVYEFRVLRPDNRMVEVEVDAASGVVLEIENDE
ncbi:PepSY domain-containing protein [Rhizobium giardinii]|uniref:Putative membrane protein YkoI n=1 Tax=Rhizobium giardinii TaxID=56731 RepID=A0A7W8UEQ7_9HYPH|nr:PepSY domain-containing protein [Rhizobium giardinii]MBB5537192.1 putative membrane protein YkoI [Rhizobium giardinii]